MDTDKEESSFRHAVWNNDRCGLAGLPGGQGLNMAHEAVDRHAAGPLADHTAIRWLGRGDEVSELTYRQLSEQTARFANVLSRLEVKPGETVCVLADRIPPLYLSALGALKYGAVFCPLFPVFGPEPIYQRMVAGDARVLVTTKGLFARKVEALQSRLPGLKHVILADAEAHRRGGIWSFSRLMAAADKQFSIPPTDPETSAILHYTSGTTALPKGAVHVHDAVKVHAVTGREVLGLEPGTVYWCTADPAWVTGTSYGILAPLVCGAVNIVDGEDFDPLRWRRILVEEQVAVWYTAPTALRRMMQADPGPRQAPTQTGLRSIFSVGEALHPDTIAWSRQSFGVPVRDTWWQTETGGIMIANLPEDPVHPGSMGRCLPGVTAAVVRLDSSKQVTVIHAPGAVGQLAIKTGWPSMFKGYLNDPERTRKSFAGEWYLTGDLVRRDHDGYFRFVGRIDDIIKTAGHMVGPAEVERVLLAHTAVLEAGVVGKPDPISGEIVKAFVTLKPGTVPGDSLRQELIGHCRSRLGAAMAPREIEFANELPKNSAGKILRRLLKDRS